MFKLAARLNTSFHLVFCISLWRFWALPSLPWVACWYQVGEERWVKQAPLCLYRCHRARSLHIQWLTGRLGRWRVSQRCQHPWNASTSDPDGSPGLQRRLPDRYSCHQRADHKFALSWGSRVGPLTMGAICSSKVILFGHLLSRKWVRGTVPDLLSFIPGVRSSCFRVEVLSNHQLPTRVISRRSLRQHWEAHVSQCHLRLLAMVLRTLFGMATIHLSLEWQVFPFIWCFNRSLLPHSRRHSCRIWTDYLYLAERLPKCCLLSFRRFVCRSTDLLHARVDSFSCCDLLSTARKRRRHD